MDFSDLTADQRAKAKACKSSDELIALAKEEGVELTDDELEAISGGWGAGCSSDGCSDHELMTDM